MKGIAGKVAIVTGGASGLGAGLVRVFVQAGLKVVIADVLDQPAGRLVHELGQACLFHHTDLCSDADLQSLVDAAAGRFGGIDFLVNVACSYAEHGVHTDRAGWHAVFDVNLIGHVMLMQKALPWLRKSAAPSIVNFSSASGHIAQGGRWVYPATKAAIEQLTRSAALDLAQDGIRVNAVLPGMIGKPPEEYASEEAARRIAGLAERFSMFSRLQTPEEVGEAVLFLCSHHARFITGSCLAADGGYTALGPQGKEVHVPRRP